MEHHFLFFPGSWLGEGTISFSSSPEELRFYTSWEGAKKTIWQWTQKVQIAGNEEEMVNVYNIHHLADGKFDLTLENTWVGEVKGEGTVDEKEIHWTFSQPGVMNGFEKYSLNENGEYDFVAEYHTEEVFQTQIFGRIWQKTN